MCSSDLSARVVLACGLMLLLLLACVDRFDWIAMRAEPLQRIAIILGIALAAMACYAAALFVSGIRWAHFMRPERN